ncbi:MAG: PAS domain S-box protein [Verrucomicrobiota bacterium]
MTMKTKAQTRLVLGTALIPFLAQATTQAQSITALLAETPIGMSMSTFKVTSGALLSCTILLILILKSLLSKTKKDLKDVANELRTTRDRLSTTSLKLEKTEKKLKNTSERYQGILLDAEVGMFQMDQEGKCSYINSALQKMSGLYPKKALTEGLQSAIHPDDRAEFDKALESSAKRNYPLTLSFRFKPRRGPEVHVACQAKLIPDENNKTESYIGWVTDITRFHEEQLQEQAKTARHAHFINETVEGYYHLVPETPIPLAESSDEMAKAILENMKIAGCNNSFAALYETTPESLAGKIIKELKDGCGPFKEKNDSVKKLIESGYKLINVETLRQTPSGNQLNLINSVVGIIENNHLLGIWGSQRNITQQKREKEELKNYAEFMHRILDSLPADVYVKDTRCRHLYTNQKMADRAGIAKENWIGKTISEVIPGTPRDHDKDTINVMKTGKPSRKEHPYKTRNESGWMETILAPLSSEEGLVEGMVGLSFETSERREKKEEAKRHRKQLEQQLGKQTEELQKSQSEYEKASSELGNANKELHIRTTELENQRYEFEKQLEEQKSAEDLLRRNEKTLLTHQKQLEETLVKRLAELESETDKRKKWEELLGIKENELQELEKVVNTRNKQLEKEIANHQQVAANLEIGQAELEKFRKEIETLEREREQEISALTEKQKTELGSEHAAREEAEVHLEKTRESLQAAQTRIQTLLEQHATELEDEVAARKASAGKLLQNTEELDELKQHFNDRIEEETRTLKNELALKQIREKATLQHEKDLHKRIQELEKALKLKEQEYNEQIQEREKAEVQRQQAEQALERLNTRQKQLVERETQKLSLNVAEIRLEEVKLRKKSDDLLQQKEDLEKLVKSREEELGGAKKEQEQLSRTLAEAKKELEDIKQGQTEFIAKETQELQGELTELKQNEGTLRKKEELLAEQAAGLEETIKKLSINLSAETKNREAAETELSNLKQIEGNLRRQEDILRNQSVELEKTTRNLSDDLKAETSNREATEKELKELQIAFDASQQNASTLVEQQTEELARQIEQHKKNEAGLKKTSESLKEQADKLQETINTRTAELAEAQREREKSELELAQLIDLSQRGEKEIEAKISEIKKGHKDEIKRIKGEHKELRLKEKYYRTLFQSSSDAFFQLNAKNGKILSANLAAAQLFGEETTKFLAGKTIGGLSPEQQPDNTPSTDMAKARLHSALEAGHETFEWQFVKADKTAFHALVSFSTIQIEEKELILAAVNDISDLKNQQTKLQQTIKEAHAANQIHSKVIDEMTETLQDSLTPVMESSSTLVKAENLTDEQKLDMEVIKRNCGTLINTMSYRRELSHLTDGSDEVEPAKCDLHELIKDLDQQFSQRAETKKLFFAVSYAQYQSANNVPKFVETDEQRVRKVLGTLLGYALSHTEKGRLGLHAARKSDEGDTICVTFELAYTGKEKQDELLSQVFNPNGAETEDMQYGLTIAQKHVQMMGGEISLDYRHGDITALTVDFPFKKTVSEIAMPSQKDKEQEAGAA